MKRTLLYVAVAAIIGLGTGYLLFGLNQKRTEEPEDHAHAEDDRWTCSMHPQILQPEAGDCPICGMDLIRAGAVTAGLGPDRFRMTENALALANIRTIKVGSPADFPREDGLTLSGKIVVSEESMAVQASYFDGRIEKLYANFEGQQIQKGQLLATLYSPELVSAQQELLTASSLRESQPGLYDAVKNKLKLWKLSDRQIQGIEQSGKVVEFMPVYATVSGTVTEVLSAEGDYVRQGQPLAKLSDLGKVWAEFDAYENQLSRLRVGQSMDIRLDAFPDQRIESPIVFIDPALNAITRTIRVRVNLDNATGRYKPGMFVTGNLNISNGKEANTPLLIPSSAVLWTGLRSLVYVKVSPDEPIFELREIEIGAQSGALTEVITGLKAGEEIVSQGTFTVDAAAQLSGKKSMMNPGQSTSLSGPMQLALSRLIPDYLKLKDALVASDAAVASAQAGQGLRLLEAVDRNSLSSSERVKLNGIQASLMAMARESGIDVQRDQFVSLNEQLVGLAAGLDSLERPLYVQQCPMANNSQGAVWLSLEKEIRNPYYGDAMLSCGSVQEVLR